MLTLSRRRSRARADLDAVPVGLTATGAPFAIPLARVSTLIAGLPGAGKSSTLAAAIAGAAELDDLAIVILDPKRVQFSHCAARCLVARGVDACTAALDDLTALMDLRYDYLEAHGLDEWPRRWGRVLVVVDELAELMATGDRKADVARSIALRRTLQLGRAAGITMLAATQRPSAALIDSDARALFGARIAHALDGTESVRMAGLDPDLAPAHRLPLGAQHAGLGYAATDGQRTPIKVRSWWTPPDDLERICTRNAHRYLDPFPTTPTRGVGKADTLTPPAHDPPAAGTPVTPLEHTTSDQRAEGEAVALREEPPAPADPDAAAILAALTRGPVKAKDLPDAAGLPEGRCRRARDALAVTGRIASTPAGWILT